MLAATGCAHVAAPLSEAPFNDIPATWSLTAAEPPGPVAPLAQWWQQMNDPMLQRLQAQALRANTTVLGAQAALRQAGALNEVAAAALWPTLGASASAQRSNADNDAGRSSSNQFRLGLDASWELDVFGARRDALSTSEATARASAASLGDVQVSIAAEVALAYISLRGTQARLATARENLASQQETQQITRWRLQAGLVSALDEQQARAATEQTTAQLPLLQTSLEQTCHALALLLGQPPATLLGLLQTSAAVPLPAKALTLSIPATTLRQRADVRAAEQQVLAARSRVSQAQAQRWPDFSIGGSLGLGALTLGALGHSAAWSGSLLAGVSLPVFDGGAARAQVRSQQSALELSQQTYRATALNALRDVEDALVALRGDRQRLDALLQAADAATQASTMAQQRYRSGLSDFQVVLETQRNQLGTQDAVTQARTSVSSDHVRLYKALGGGWEAETALAESALPTRPATANPIDQRASSP